MPPSPPPGFLPFILRLVLQTRTPARAHAARGKQLEVNEAAQGRRRSYGTIHRQLHQGKPTQPHSAASGFTSPSILPARCLLFHLTTEDVAVKGLKIIKDGFSINANVQGDCQQYKREPRCKPEVFRSVFVGSTNRNGGLGSCHVSNIAQYHRKDCGVGKPSNVSLVGGPGPHVILTSDVKPLLMALIPSGACSEDKKNANSQIPGSPKPSPFSNLPDMSPKKVSSSHYVSPLQQTKGGGASENFQEDKYGCQRKLNHRSAARLSATVDARPALRPQPHIFAITAASN